MKETKKKRRREKSRWGSARIAGPRHDFREKLMLAELDRSASLTGASSFLEAGCGSASFSKKLLSKFPNLEGQGFDRARDFWPMISESFGEDLLTRFSFHAGTFEEIPQEISKEKFDLIVAGEVLEHVEDDAAAVGKMRGLLVDGGLLLASVPHRMDYWSFEDEWAGHVRRYEAGEARKLFEGNGFRVVSLRAWGYPATKLYVDLVFKRLIASGGGKVDDAKKGLLASLARRLAFLLLHVDCLFLGNHRGLDLIILARKK